MNDIKEITFQIFLKNVTYSQVFLKILNGGFVMSLIQGIKDACYDAYTNDVTCLAWPQKKIKEHLFNDINFADKTLINFADKTLIDKAIVIGKVALGILGSIPCSILAGVGIGVTLLYNRVERIFVDEKKVSEPVVEVVEVVEDEKDVPVEKIPPVVTDDASKEKPPVVTEDASKVEVRRTLKRRLSESVSAFGKRVTLFQKNNPEVKVDVAQNEEGQEPVDAESATKV